MKSVERRYYLKEVSSVLGIKYTTLWNRIWKLRTFPQPELANGSKWYFTEYEMAELKKIYG